MTLHAVFDAAVFDRVRLAVLGLELGRPRQDIGHGRERVLPYPSIHILHARALGYDGLASGRPTALERKLMRHKVCAGCRQQEPDKAIAADIRARLLCVGCHGHFPGPQRKVLRAAQDERGPGHAKSLASGPVRSIRRDVTSSKHLSVGATLAARLHQSDSRYSSTLILAYPGRLASAAGASSTSGALSMLSLARFSQSCSKISAKYAASFASSKRRLASRLSDMPCSDQFW